MTPLYKEHSYAACISEGYKFLAEHLLLILKVLAPLAAANAVFSMLFFILHMEVTMSLLTADTSIAPASPSVWTAWGALLFLLLSSITSLLMGGRLFLLFRRMFGIETSEGEDNQQTAKQAAWKTTMIRTGQLTWRSMPYLTWPLLLNFGNLFLISPITQFIGGLDKAWVIFIGCLMLLITIAAIVAAVPLTYSFYARMMQPLACEREVMVQHSFATAYRKGFRYWGKTFGVLLLSCFVMAMATIVPLLPLFISAMAYSSSIISSLLGDTTIIPTAASASMIAVNMVCFFCLNILSIAVPVSLLYLYGDIFSKGQEQNIEE